MERRGRRKSLRPWPRVLDSRVSTKHAVLSTLGLWNLVNELTSSDAGDWLLCVWYVPNTMREVSGPVILCCMLTLSVDQNNKFDIPILLNNI